MSVYTTREEWLQAAKNLLDPLFEGTPANPHDVRVSVGFPAGSRGGNGAKAIGQCHYAAEDSVPQIFIHPELTDRSRVLDVLAHELAHAYLPVGTGHKGDFVTTVRAIGLTGKATATTAGNDFLTDAGEILTILGAYPHSRLTYDAATGRKQTTRQVKVECECGRIYRASRKVIEEAAELGCIDRTCTGEVSVG